MAALQDKLELAESMVSSSSYMAAKGDLDTCDISELTEKEMRHALLLVKAYTIGARIKRKQHFTIGAL